MAEGPSHPIFKGKNFRNLYTRFIYTMTNIYFVMTDGTVFYYIFYFSVSVSGIYFDGPLFYTIMLIDIVHRISTLKFVIKTVSLNTWNLIWVGILLTIVTFIFSLFANFYIRYLIE